MFEHAFLGQVRLRSMGAVTPPYFGQWGLNGGASGQVGPFDTPEEAFQAAVKAVRDAGAKRLPDDGFAKVVDAKGADAGPKT